MIFGTDLSYCSYANPNVIGTLNLYDVVTTSDVVTNTHYSYACCKNITSISSYSSTVNTYSYTYDFTYKERIIKDDINYLVTTIGYVFSSYNYQGFFTQSNTGYIYDMSGMFKGCTSLTNAELKYVNISNCENMDEMFADCTYLKTVTFGEYKTKPILHADNIFKNCYNLETVYIPYTLKNYYSNISGQDDLHVRFYNHVNDFYDSYSYTYVTNKIWEPTSKFVTFTLNSIGCIMFDENLEGLWDSIIISIMDKEIFSMKNGQYMPTDPLIADAVVLNNKYIGKTITIEIPIEYMYNYLDITFVARKGLDYICKISENIYFKEGMNNIFDIHSVYFTKKPYPVDITVAFDDYSYTYTRPAYSTSRGTFNIPDLIYNYPDGDTLTVIDVKSGDTWVETIARIDPNRYTSYVLVDADVIVDNELTYLVRLDNTTHDEE